jgi:hypothetical protein
MLPNGLGQLAEGAEATARCPATPPLKFSFGNLALRAGVNSLERLTQTHRAAEFGVLATTSVGVDDHAGANVSVG